VPDTAALVQAARQQGYQDGYRDGLVALDGFKQSFAMQTVTQVAAIVRSTGEQLDALQQQMAQALAGAAIELARQIVRSELATRPELVATVALEGLDTLLLSARHITLRVHPDDHALVAAGAADDLAARGARLIGDVSVTRGGCVVESDLGVIDASIEARWHRAAAALGQEVAWDAGTSMAGAAE
jgi:flagellar assembly protein FliH